MANLQQILMQGEWKVDWVDASAAGELALGDKLEFQSNMSIQRVSGGTWAGPCTPTAFGQTDGLLGATMSDQRPFSIAVAGPKLLSCFFGAAPRRRWLTDLTAFVLGTLAGGIAGAATGSLRVGLLSGAAAAATATFAAQTNMAVQTGPSATLIVDEGHMPGMPEPGGSSDSGPGRN